MIAKAMPISNKNSSGDDGWDWPTILYVATVILKISEKDFWRMAPVKFKDLGAVHNELNKSK